MKEMNYNTDRPIESINEDLLGRATFSKQLAKAIYDYTCKDSLVLGLFGKWGTGKTSIINMAFQFLEELSENDHISPILVKFSPWHYSDNNNLISQFFTTLKTAINADSNEEKRKKIGELLSDYSEGLEIASIIPGIGAPLTTLVKTFTKRWAKELSKPKDLFRTKGDLEKALLELDQKIIVFIDDIDRLTNSQIRDIFQLVKQVGDLPNIIYILAMDREIINNALSEVHQTDGNEYLEKIIQVPFEIPELKRTRLHDIFFSKLNIVICKLPGIIWEQNYFDRVFQYCIAPYIQTIRDVNRVINTFQFRYGMFFEETSLEDMLGLTTLEVLNPELYKWIRANKEKVCGGYSHSFDIYEKNPQDIKKEYAAAFRLLGCDPNLSMMSVASMFPVFAKDVDAHFYDSANSSNIRQHMRAAQPERFELYFAFDLDDVKVPRSEIYNCLNVYKEDDLKAAIVRINDQGNIMYFLDEFQALVDEIPYNRLVFLAGLLFELKNGFKGESRKALFSISAGYKADYLAEAIIKRLKTDSERFYLYKNAILNANLNSIGTVANSIRKKEIAYKNLSDGKDNIEEVNVSLSQLKELEKLYLDRIQEFASSDDFLDSEDFLYAFYLWTDLDKDAAQDYLSKLLKDNVKKLKFICKMAGRWNGNQGSGWDFTNINYSEYASEDDIYNSIKKLNAHELEEFSELEKIKLASFLLNYHKDEFSHVTEQNAKQYVEKWKEKLNDASI